MDFADATLVLLAERLGVFDVLTLDRRGFGVFRSAQGKRFTLVLR
jgi:predicted nucleic acid-binding protein